MPKRQADSENYIPEILVIRGQHYRTDDLFAAVGKRKVINLRKVSYMQMIEGVDPDWIINSAADVLKDKWNCDGQVVSHLRYAARKKKKQQEEESDAYE